MNREARMPTPAIDTEFDLDLTASFGRRCAHSIRRAAA